MSARGFAAVQRLRIEHINAALARPGLRTSEKSRLLRERREIQRALSKVLASK